MKIAQITFTSRMGLPAYSHEEIVAVAILDDSKDATEQMARLKATVNGILYGASKVTTAAAVQTSVVNKETVGTKTVDLAAGKTDKPELEGKVLEMKDGVTKAEAEKQEKDQKAKAAALAKAEKEAAKAAADAEKAAKAAAKTVEKYDPAIKEHTDTVAAQLNKIYGTAWKADLVRAKKVSREIMAGQDFRNTATGEILPAFIESLKSNFGDLESGL